VETASERQRLLSLVADLVIKNGLHDLSLSWIARSIGSNNRMLLYYFKSREKLLEEVFQEVGRQFPKIDGIFDRLRENGDLQTRLERAWDDIVHPDNMLLLQMFFQRFGRALYEREENAFFLKDVSGTWVASLTPIIEAEGYASDKSRIVATGIVALWRGLQFALVAGEAENILMTSYRRTITSLLGQLASERETDLSHHA
jgi:AcrR family transcriptional regulator